MKLIITFFIILNLILQNESFKNYYSFSLSNETSILKMSELKVYYATYATNYLVSGLYDKSIQVLDINEKVIVNKFDVSNGGHLNYVHLLEPIGNRFIATVAQTEEIKIWDIVNGELKYTFNKTNQGLY